MDREGSKHLLSRELEHRLTLLKSDISEIYHLLHKDSRSAVIERKLAQCLHFAHIVLTVVLLVMTLLSEIRSHSNAQDAHHASTIQNITFQPASTFGDLVHIIEDAIPEAKLADDVVSLGLNGIAALGKSLNSMHHDVNATLSSIHDVATAVKDHVASKAVCTDVHCYSLEAKENRLCAVGCVQGTDTITCTIGHPTYGLHTFCVEVRDISKGHSTGLSTKGCLYIDV